MSNNPSPAGRGRGPPRERWEGEGKMRQASGTEALERVRAMRREATPAEARLWSALRGRRLAGAKFRRQMWVGGFIADFCCVEARLIVEVDGSQHGGARDARRDAMLNAAGYRVLRFWNNEVVDDLESVLVAIAGSLPSPSQA